jgi:uncharacterized protein
MSPPVKMLFIFVDETDTWEGRSLYEAIVRRLRQLDLAGATVHTGIMGFGRHMQVHHKGLFGISDDRPVAITVVDEEKKLRQALPELQVMVKEGLMVLLDAELVG